MRRAGWVLLPTAVVLVGIAGVAAAGPGSPVTTAYAAAGDGLFSDINGNATMADVRVPSGSYAINGKVSLRNETEDDKHGYTICRLLSAGKQIDGTSGGFRLAASAQAGDSHTIALQGIAKFGSPKTITIKCSTDGSKVSSKTRLTAIKVTRVRFQAPG